MSKPENWDMLPPKIKRELAIELATTPRGKYIISEALYYGRKLLRRNANSDISDIEDMEILQAVFDRFSPEQRKKGNQKV